MSVRLVLDIGGQIKVCIQTILRMRIDNSTVYWKQHKHLHT